MKRKYEEEIFQIKQSNFDLQNSLSSFKYRNSPRKENTSQKEEELERIKGQLKEVIEENTKIADRTQMLDRERYFLEKELKERIDEAKKKDEEYLKNCRKLNKRIEKYQK